ncbi:MAG: hypothetical protein H6Q59_3374, partial [Firmicutes bacterium]|nr:hypothetical protein [Bacillota bacterium]
DKSKGYLNNYTDTHGGFLGDGCTYIEIQFSGDYTDTIENEFNENGKWRQLPLSKNLYKAVYGDEKYESLVDIDENISQIPEMSSGYYYFKDRHSESKDSSDDTYLFSRSSFNFDIILYDIDEHILYIFQLDT